MAIKISGVLRDGMGQPIPKCTIELHCKKTSLTVVVETDARLGVDITGAYNMQVEPGEYNVSLYINGFPPKRIGSIEVYADSRPGTLNDFLMMPGESDLTPELVLIFQQLRDEARQAANETKADKELVDNILTNVLTIQTDITEKQQQVSSDTLDASNSKISAAASSAASSDNAASSAADLIAVTALKSAAEAAANSAELSKNSANTDATRAERAATGAEASKNSASTDASHAEAARTISEGIQTDLTQKYEQVVSDTTAVIDAKTIAVNAAGAAASDAQATAADRKAVYDDRKLVYADKGAAREAATTATNKAIQATTEAERAKTEADRAVAASDGKQDKSDLLTAISELTTAENGIIYTTDVDEVATMPVTNIGYSLISAEDSETVLETLGISNTITESNSVFSKSGKAYKKISEGKQFGWDFFGVNGEGIAWSSTESVTMSHGTPALVVAPAGGAFDGWPARGTGLQVLCHDARNAATSVWKAVETGRAWIAGMDVYMPPTNVGLVMLHVNEANFHFSGVGDMLVPGQITCKSMLQTSDENKKHSINDIENSDDIIMSWGGKTFRLNDNNNLAAGVIAQDIMKKFPVAVTKLEDGSLAVDYSSLQAPMIEAMKNRISTEAKLLKRIDELEKRLNDLLK